MERKAIVVIDDDAVDLETIKRQVAQLPEARGLEIKYFDSSLSGRDYLSEQRDCGLLILDIHMPDLDGIEILQVLQASKQGCAVLLVTGVNTENMQLAGSLGQAFGLNIVGQIEKPLCGRVLQKYIRQVMAS